MNNNEVHNGKNKPLENAMDSLKESGYKVEKQKYNFANRRKIMQYH